MTNWLKIAKIGLEGIRNSATFKKPGATNWLKLANIGPQGIKNSATLKSLTWQIDLKLRILVYKVSKILLPLIKKPDVTNWHKIAKICPESIRNSSTLEEFAW